MVVHKIDDIIIYNTSRIFDKYSTTRECLEKKIAGWIVENLEKDIIYDIINKNYEGFTAEDKRRITERVLRLLSKNKIARVNQIEKSLESYFENENNINIQGFVRFRLKEYRLSLENITDKAIDKYIIEKEYFEFVDLIKEYIKYQGPMVEHLNVISCEKNTLYADKNGNDITREIEIDCSFDTDLSEDDKLLTALVLSAPEKIVWHNSDRVRNKELKETVKAIFGDSVIFCNGCRICRKNMENSIDNF